MDSWQAPAIGALGVISAYASLQMGVNQWQNKVATSKISTMPDSWDEASLLQSIAHGAGRNCLTGSLSSHSYHPSPLQTPLSESHFVLAGFVSQRNQTVTDNELRGGAESNWENRNRAHDRSGLGVLLWRTDESLRTENKKTDVSSTKSWAEEWKWEETGCGSW